MIRGFYEEIPGIGTCSVALYPVTGRAIPVVGLGSQLQTGLQGSLLSLLDFLFSPLNLADKEHHRNKGNQEHAYSFMF